MFVDSMLGLDPSESWLVRLLINLVGYATIFVPGFFIIRYVKNKGILDTASKYTKQGCVWKTLQLCVKGEEAEKPSLEEGGSAPVKTERSTRREAIVLLYCFLGLQVSFLTWGVLQEKIMTQNYLEENNPAGQFKDSQFLVLVNRILAFFLAVAYLVIFRESQPAHTAPIYKYSYCSLSNIMSSWCQYEALKFVSFPTQVLAKASKIIPVMLMGKIVSKKTYEYYEYLTAVLISVGMTLFLLGSEESSKGGTTTLSGVVILLGYMTFDSFTSNWQGELFHQHKMSSMQMMAGVNLFSVVLTSTSLLQQGGITGGIAFMFSFPKFLFDCVVLSLCSATGQLFIYYTIQQFGPVIFIIMMTIRQGLAILLSCIIYGHAVSASGLVGVVLVFGAIFLRTYCNQRLKVLRTQQPAAKS